MIFITPARQARVVIVIDVEPSKRPLGQHPIQKPRLLDLLWEGLMLCAAVFWSAMSQVRADLGPRSRVCEQQFSGWGPSGWLQSWLSVWWLPPCKSGYDTVVCPLSRSWCPRWELRRYGATLESRRLLHCFQGLAGFHSMTMPGWNPAGMVGQIGKGFILPLTRMSPTKDTWLLLPVWPGRGDDGSRKVAERAAPMGVPPLPGFAVAKGSMLVWFRWRGGGRSKIRVTNWKTSSKAQ